MIHLLVTLILLQQHLKTVVITSPPSSCNPLRDKYVQIFVITAQPCAGGDKVLPCCCRSRAQKLPVSLCVCVCMCECMCVCVCRPSYAEGPELCVEGCTRVAAAAAVVVLVGTGMADVGAAGGEPVCTWAWNWAICSGLASVFSRVFSCSS